jgi:hypothetical protein
MQPGRGARGADFDARGRSGRRGGRVDSEAAARARMAGERHGSVRVRKR